MDQENYIRALLRLQVAAVGGIGTLLTVVFTQTKGLPADQAELIERSINYLSESVDAAQALVQQREPPSEEKD